MLYFWYSMGASAIVESSTMWNSLLCGLCHQVRSIGHFHWDPQGHHHGECQTEPIHHVDLVLYRVRQYFSMRKYPLDISACHPLEHFSISRAPGGTSLGLDPCWDCAFAMRKRNEDTM